MPGEARWGFPSNGAAFESHIGVLQHINSLIVLFHQLEAAQLPDDEVCGRPPHHEAAQAGHEGVPRLELAGGDAALPGAVIELQLRVTDQEGTVARAEVPRPVVFTRKQSERDSLSLPPTAACQLQH